MSAPPMAMTMWMPNSSASTVMIMSGTRPLPCADCSTNWTPYQIQPSRMSRLSQCRAGRISGLPLILPDSLPNAMTEPENVTAPIRTPM